MPSTTRRRLLASLATGGAVGLAGCAGQQPRSVDAAETGERGELLWQYPEAEVGGGGEGIGYASIGYEGEHPADASALRFDLNTTVGGVAAGEPYTDYEADWARFHLGPPSSYTATHPFEMWVRPPTWPDIRTGYDRRGGRREFVVELPEIDTAGTITLPVVFVPVDDDLPDVLHCSFTVQAADPGLLGEPVRASGHGTIDLAELRSS